MLTITGKVEYADWADRYRMKTFAPPEHIIFGARFPHIQRGSEGSRQYVFSTTNYNLFLNESDLDDNGTFTIGSLLKADKNCPYCLRWTSITLPECELMCKTCSLLTEKHAGTQTADEIRSSDWLKLKKAYLHETPRIYRCKLLSTLLNCTTTSAQRRFAEAYYQLAISWLGFSDDVISRFCDTHKTYGGVPRSFDRSHIGSWSKAIENEKVIRGILDSLEAPAMIPQVWIRWIHGTPGCVKLEEKEWGCVDFLFIYRNELHVVEIYPSLRHTGYSLDGNVATSEERLSSRLNLEENLRNRGYKLHRFSEWEILNANESELPDLVSEAVGISLSSFKPKMSPQQWPRNAHIDVS